MQPPCEDFEKQDQLLGTPPLMAKEGRLQQLPGIQFEWVNVQTTSWSPVLRQGKGAHVLHMGQPFNGDTSAQ